MHAESTDDLDRTSLTRLLSLGVKATGGPVDELLDRLEAEDGASWFCGWLRDGPLGPEASRFLAGDLALGELEALIARGKKALAAAGSRDDRIEATALYFLAVAAGIAHHGKVLTRTSRGELDGILIELASALPAPWSEFLERAVEQPPGEG